VKLNLPIPCCDCVLGDFSLSPRAHNCSLCQLNFTVICTCVAAAKPEQDTTQVHIAVDIYNV
jgi:hypothetical protein